MKPLKLTKAKAAAFYKSLLGSPAGMEMTGESQFSIVRGMTEYRIWPYDAWPDGSRILLYIIIGSVGVKQIMFFADTFEPDWKWTEREERRLAQYEGR